MATPRWLLLLIGVAGLTFSLTSAEAQGANSGGQAQPPLATGGLISSIVAAPVVGQPTQQCRFMAPREPWQMARQFRIMGTILSPATRRAECTLRCGWPTAKMGNPTR